MKQELWKFAKVLEDPCKRLSSWKLASNKKIIGCLPMYIPGEIIYAAGMLPITLFGNGSHAKTADRHLLTFTCGGLRSSYDMLLNGDYEFLDGIVIPLICDQMRFTSDFWDMSHPFFFFHQLWLSFRVSDAGKNYLINEFTRLKSHLEEFAGKNIPLEAIEKSIHIYNENRSLLRKVSELRKERPSIMSADDMVKVVASSLIMPKEEHSKLLIEVLAKAEESLHEIGSKIKLVLVGHPCYPPAKKVLDLIEELGGIIVDDDLFIGRRYFDKDVEISGDPIESLAKHFMDSAPCPIRHYPDHFLNIHRSTPDYGDVIIKMFKESGAKGLINLGETYCDPYDLEYPYLKARLEEGKIPFLNIRGSLEATSLESVRTRVAAFLEMLHS